MPTGKSRRRFFYSAKKFNFYHIARNAFWRFASDKAAILISDFFC